MSQTVSQMATPVLTEHFPFLKLIQEFFMLSVAGNGLLRQVSKFFSMFMSNPMRWKNDYLLCKYLIIFSSIYNLECTGSVRELLFHAIHWKIWKLNATKINRWIFGMMSCYIICLQFLVNVNGRILSTEMYLIVF